MGGRTVKGKTGLNPLFENFRKTLPINLGESIPKKWGISKQEPERRLRISLSYESQNLNLRISSCQVTLLFTKSAIPKIQEKVYIKRTNKKQVSHGGNRSEV
jgi:hypothetical protein